MFLLNSCLGLFPAAASRRRPFSRSYGAILPSSLAVLLPPALGSSPHPPVSVYGTGRARAIAAFHGTGLGGFATFFRSASRARLPAAVFPAARLTRLRRSSLSRLPLFPCVPAVLPRPGTGISACCPSAAPPGLALGPDLPGADQLYPGNLGYPAWGIPTPISLLIPAFSLPMPPPPLGGAASPAWGRSPTAHGAMPWAPGFGGVFQPRTFSAQGLSASELLRTL